MCWCITHAAIAKLTATRFMIPVSYTHLDVYKRQLQSGVVNIMTLNST